MTHPCSIPGCRAVIPSARLMCLGHWKLVPQPIKDRVNNGYALWRAGELAIHVLRAVQQEAIEAVAGPAPAEKEPKPSAELLAFARLALRTLDRQADYFAGRSPDVLRECKDLERRLRKSAREVIDRTNTTPTLFPEGHT